jgi:dUTP pyrophosphatase
VLLINLGLRAYTIAPGDRIAQLVIAAVTRVELEEVDEGGELSSTARGTGGFGHTG